MQEKMQRSLLGADELINDPGLQRVLLGKRHLLDLFVIRQHVSELQLDYLGPEIAQEVTALLVLE